jgi:hypothetical protein
MIDTTSDPGVKNKLTLQRSDDLEGLMKKERCEDFFYPLSKERYIRDHPQSISKRGRQTRQILKENNIRSE